MRYFLDVASCVAHMLLRDLARSLYSPLFLAPAFVVIISRHVFSCSWGVIGRRSFVFYLAHNRASFLWSHKRVKVS